VLKCVHGFLLSFHPILLIALVVLFDEVLKIQCYEENMNTKNRIINVIGFHFSFQSKNSGNRNNIFLSALEKLKFKKQNETVVKET